MTNTIKVVIHQTHHQIGDFKNIYHYLEELISTYKNKKINQSEIHLFPESFLSGYPLQDLCLQKSFIEKYDHFIKQVKELFLLAKLHEDSTSHHLLFLMGGPSYKLPEESFSNHLKIQNSLYAHQIVAKNLKGVEGEKSLLTFSPIYHKMLLPNYDIFDEKKYFTKGSKPLVLNWVWPASSFSNATSFSKKIIITICEDMWGGYSHERDPLKEIYDSFKLDEGMGMGADLIINFSASPFHLQKGIIRQERAKIISKSFKSIPLVYVNRVGGEDEILFDGQSFIVKGEETLFEGKLFEEERAEVELPLTSELNLKSECFSYVSANHTPLDLPTLDLKTLKLSTLRTDEECFEAVKALQFGFKEYSQKIGARKFLVAVSGGLDSGVVAAVAKLALKKGEEISAIYMPSKFSSELSLKLATSLCQKLNIPLHHFPIKFIHSTTKRLYKDFIGKELTGVTDENLQSRLRGMLLYTFSNQSSSMVINTSNKSEIACGYSTIYGDSVGAISMLGDLYKSEIFKIAHFINKEAGEELIPLQMIERPPSAELRFGQTDEMSLPPYERLDFILEAFLSYRYTSNDLISLGFSKEEVLKTIDLYQKSEFKRKQFPPIIKIKNKSFGFGYRVPITKNPNLY